MNNVYEKPSIKLVPLRSSRNIAARCWGTHGKGNKYYDTDGPGYLEFFIADGSCTTEGQLTVMYYDKKGDTQPEQIYPGNPKYDELLALLGGAGGSWGQPFTGENRFPDTPGGMS